MDSVNTIMLGTSDTDLRRAATLLREGELVAFPTETVYGLGADARQGDAVARVYDAKGRPSFNPLIVHVTDVDAARRHVEWSDTAARLARAFWPGPLTLVLPLRPRHGIASLVTAGLETLAIRVPAHPVAQRMLQVFDGPVAAPSANPSGRISPTTPAHVRAGLNGRIAAIVDGGRCTVGLESTIVGLVEEPTLLRPGGLATDRIEAVLDAPLLVRAPDAALSAPGQLTSHYAPRAPLRMNATHARDAEVMLGFGPMSCDANLSRTGSLTEAAARLFDMLHLLDDRGQPIAVAPIPDQGLGCAINDRLRRAAAPRDP